MGTPTKLAAMKLKLPPSPQMMPPSRPSRWSPPRAFQKPENDTGEPTSGFFMKYTFTKKQHSNAPRLKHTDTEYGVRVWPLVMERVTKGANAPISRPETTLTVMPFRETLRPAS